MKSIGLIILFISSSIIAQSRAEYYPLQIGNKWVYKVTDYEGDVSPTPPSISFHSKEVIGDTVMDNGKKYFVILENGVNEYERFDTLTNEIIYYSSNAGSQVNEEQIYSLNYIKDSTVVWNSSFGGMKFQITFYQMPSSDTSTINLIGDGLGSVNVSFKKFIGIVYNSYSYDFGVSYSNLIGYRINGKQWGQLTGVNTNLNIVSDYKLEQNYPNPFNPTTKIMYKLPKEGMVSLKIYDMLGREVKTLVNEHKNAGSYNIEFNANHLTSGIYFYRLTSGNFTQVKKLILIK
jgi:hypothetical protein